MKMDELMKPETSLVMIDLCEADLWDTDSYGWLDLQRQMIAKSYAERFNACSPPKKVETGLQIEMFH